jgi:hypothetical protein
MLEFNGTVNLRGKGPYVLPAPFFLSESEENKS